MNRPRLFIPLEEQLPDDLQADDVLVPFPEPAMLPPPKTDGLSYPDWLARLGRVRNGQKRA